MANMAHRGHPARTTRRSNSQYTTADNRMADKICLVHHGDHPPFLSLRRARLHEHLQRNRVHAGEGPQHDQGDERPLKSEQVIVDRTRQRDDQQRG